MGLFGLFKRNTSNNGPSNEYFDFEDKYLSKVEKLSDAIDDIDTCTGTASVTLKNFDKKKSAVLKLKEFCYSNGKGGVEYYDDNYGTYESDVEQELADYMKDSYQEELEEEEYWKEYKKQQQAVTRLILSSIEKNDGKMLQKDLKKLLPDDQAKYYDSTLSNLIESKKVSRNKVGNLIEISLVK